MAIFIQIDSEEFIINGILSDISPGPDWIEVPPQTKTFVRPKWSVSGEYYYEGATTAEIDLFIEGVISQTWQGLLYYAADISVATLFSRPLPEEVSSGILAVLASEQNQILAVRPDYEFVTHNLPTADFKYRVTIEEDAGSFVIPLLVWHKGINELYINDLIIETVPFDLPTKTIGVPVKAGDKVRLTYK